MDKYYTKQPSCVTPDGREWFASGGGNKPMELDKNPCPKCEKQDRCTQPCDQWKFWFEMAWDNVCKPFRERLKKKK